MLSDGHFYRLNQASWLTGYAGHVSQTICPRCLTPAVQRVEGLL